MWKINISIDYHTVVVRGYLHVQNFGITRIGLLPGTLEEREAILSADIAVVALDLEDLAVEEGFWSS